MPWAGARKGVLERGWPRESGRLGNRVLRLIQPLQHATWEFKIQ